MSGQKRGVFPLTWLRSAPFLTLHSARVDTVGCYICLRKIIFWMFSHLDQKHRLLHDDLRIHQSSFNSICKHQM